MNIIFLTNNYYPVPFANGVCIHSLAKECVKRNHNVHVICTGNWRGSSCQEYEGVIVHKVKMPYYNALFDYYYNHRRSYFGKLMFYMGRIVALSKKFYHLNSYPLRDNVICRRMVKVCERIISENQVSMLVASYTPVEGIKAGALIKQHYPYIDTIYYSLDTLSNESGFGVLPEKMRRSSGIKQEIKYFGLFDKIVLMNCHKHHYEEAIFDSFRTKFKFADFPLFQIRTKDVQIKKTIVFAGTLYRGIRNPRPALELIEPILDVYTFHYYGLSDCNDIISEFAEKCPGHVVNHGVVSHEEVMKAMDEAELLLSIGNFHTEMAPSKIYEQMSTGKPIIHTYAEETDPCLPELKKYGNALCVDINHVEDADLCGFVRNLRLLDKKELELKFKEATPSYSIDLFTEKQ